MDLSIGREANSWAMKSTFLRVVGVTRYLAMSLSGCATPIWTTLGRETAIWDYWLSKKCLSALTFFLLFFYC